MARTTAPVPLALLGRGRRPAEVEVDAGGLLGTRGGLEVGLLPHAEEIGEEDGGEAQPARVVGLGPLVVAAALDRDAVLRALECDLQVTEVLVRLELGVA